MTELTYTRKGLKTREKILKTAKQLFAANGFHGTSLNEIVDQAGVNKRMIYHYFGDKEGLYRSLFVEQWTQLKNQIDQLISSQDQASDEDEPGQIMGAFVSTLFDFMSADGDFIRLLSWEGLEGGEVSKSIWQEIRGPLYLQVENMIRLAQKKGEVDPRVNPQHIVIIFLGAISFYVANAKSLRDIVQVDPLSKAGLQAFKAQLLLLSQKYLMPKKNGGET